LIVRSFFWHWANGDQVGSLSEKLVVEVRPDDIVENCGLSLLVISVSSCSVSIKELRDKCIELSSLFIDESFVIVDFSYEVVHGSSVLIYKLRGRKVYKVFS
jgi:hypothetical protein